MESLTNTLHLDALDSEICTFCSASDIPNVLLGAISRRWPGTEIGTFQNIAQRRHICAFFQFFYCVCLSVLDVDDFEYLLSSPSSIMVHSVPELWERSLGLDVDDIPKNSAFLQAWHAVTKEARLESLNHDLLSYSFTCFLNRESVSPIVRQYRNDHFLFSPSGLKAYNSEKRLRLLTATEVRFPYVRFDLIRSWLNICENEHKEVCSTETDITTCEPPLYLIDVKTRRIATRSLRSRYIALSYVWGNYQLNKNHGMRERRKTSSDTGTYSENLRYLPTRLPRTVEDAIVVVRLLGEQYLWVDAYCLDQGDTETRRQAICAMDAIYERAYLTIFDLSGVDSDSGLSGVSKPLKVKPQISLSTGSATYTATERVNLNRIVVESPWNSRAWTFQEGIISRRRLGFHEKGTFLWCKQELFHSMVEIVSPHQRRLNIFDDTNGSCGAMGYELLLGSDNFRAYGEIVAAYTPRLLSFDSDAENAIIGILKKFSQIQEASFVFGLPENDLHRALLWVVEEDDEADVFLLRRQGFPSWSWLGWSGNIEYCCWLVEPTINPLIEGMTYPEYTLATRAMSGVEGTCCIIVTNQARLRTVSSCILEIESRIAKFKAVLLFRDHDSEDLEKTLRESDRTTGYAWQIVDYYGNEVPVGLMHAKTLGTYIYLDKKNIVPTQQNSRPDGGAGVSPEMV